VTEEDETVVILRKIKAAAKKLWAHPVGKPLVYVLIGFVIGAILL